MLFAGLLGVRWVSCHHGHGAGNLFEGSLDAQLGLARGMDDWLDAGLGREDFATGSSRFDGEWLFGTYVMAVLGYAQTAQEHPELTAHHRTQIGRCLDALTAPETTAFDREAWGVDPLDDLGGPRPHAAYLGYAGLALAVARELDPQSPHAVLEQRVIDHLSAHLERSPLGLLATYPGEVYPVDNLAILGALATHDRATGEDHSAVMDALSQRLRTAFRDPNTGLLYQAVHPRTGQPIDAPRGSGTALGAYFASFADLGLSRDLYAAIDEHLSRRAFGFGTTREYPVGAHGSGDIDSGPVLLGQGVSATGFTIALARIHGDRDTFAANYTTAAFFGGPVGGTSTHYALGGPIGDALLFALTTAQPGDVL